MQWLQHRARILKLAWYWATLHGKAPHVVTPVKGGGYNCDASCSSWKSIAFCSHTEAVADAKKKLTQFLTFLQNKKITPNMTNLVTSGMLWGHGRKGGVTPHTHIQLKPPETRLSSCHECEKPAGHSQRFDFNCYTSHRHAATPVSYWIFPSRVWLLLSWSVSVPITWSFPVHGPNPYTQHFYLHWLPQRQIVHIISCLYWIRLAQLPK